MSKDRAHDTRSDSGLGVRSSDADWHPFNVWRNQMRGPQNRPLATPHDAAAMPSWDPYCVWKTQVKRR